MCKAFHEGEMLSKDLTYHLTQHLTLKKARKKTHKTSKNGIKFANHKIILYLCTLKTRYEKRVDKITINCLKIF